MTIFLSMATGTTVAGTTTATTSTTIAVAAATTTISSLQRATVSKKESLETNDPSVVRDYRKQSREYPIR